MTEAHEEVGVEFRCDAGHSDGVPCPRPVHIRKGRVALCGEHMDALRFGLEADEICCAVEQLQSWCAQTEDVDRRWLGPKLEGLLAEAKEEHHAAMLRARRFLEYADGAK